MKKHIALFFLLVAIPAFTNAASNNQSPKQIKLSKAVQVIDGDSIKDGNLKIRLYGIDAPELDQQCTDAKGTSWHCGKASKRKLEIFIKGKHLICNIKGTDLYKRKLAICKLDGLDINQYMVEQGYAVAYTKYSDKYEIDEEYAINNNKGIWQGDFKEPEEFRKEQKLKKSKKEKANNPQIKTLHKSSSKTAPKENSNNKQRTKNKHAPSKKS